MWFYVIGLRSSAQQALMSISDGVNDIYLYVDTTTSTASVRSNSISAATWYRVAMKATDATNQAGFFGALGAAPTAITTFNTAPTTPTTIVIGGTRFSADWFDGRLAAVKLYNAVLTDAECENELTQMTPVRTANLLHWHPFIVAETADYSGNAAALTAGAGATTTEEGPPIPWTQTRPWPFVVAAEPPAPPPEDPLRVPVKTIQVP